MKVVFRADASTAIGTGHVFRCLTLAEKMRKYDFEVAFICRKLPGDMIAEIERLNFPVYSEDQIGEMKCDWFVVDHYDLDYNFESSVRSIARSIMVIDDLANRVHDCEVLLDQNLYDDMETRYLNLVPENSNVLAGPHFALLRPEFADARLRVQRSNHLQRIFVFFGGSDPTNETMKVLRAISELKAKDLAVDVLVGLSNPNRKEIELFVSELPGVVLRQYTERISELMLRADLAIGAGGATSWERCCLGLPSITIAVAENQELLSQTLANHGYQFYLGVSNEVTEELIVDAIENSLARFSDTVAMGLNSMTLVDGNGTDRVLSAMRCL